MNSSAVVSISQPTGLGRLAGWCYDHRRRVVATWVAVLVAVIGASQIVGGNLSDSFSSSGSQSGRAQTFLAHGFPAQAGDAAQVVFHTSGPVSSPANARRIDRLVAAIAPLPHVTAVVNPLSRRGAGQVSQSRRIAYATVQFDQRADDLPDAVVNRVIHRAKRARRAGFDVQLGGSPISAVQNLSPGSSEGIGIVAAIVIMLLAFGSVVAMGLPIITALLGVGIGYGLVALLSHALTVPTFGPELMAMIGLGVGIDYALFVVTRYRDGLGRGRSPRDATISALQTSGRAVLFAGGTVVISLLGLFLIDQPFMDGMALASIFAVIAVLLGALTLLPAAFGFCRRSIDRVSLPALGRRRTTRPDTPGFWRRWSQLIQRRPLPSAIGALVLVGVLLIPFFSLRLAFADAGNDPTDQTTRQAFDLMSRGFGPGTNGPLVIAVKLNGPQQVPVAQALARQAGRTAGVASVTPVQFNADRTAAVILATPTTAPSAASTVSLVHRLRDHVIPGVVDGQGVEVLVGGETAASVDSATHLSQRLPLVIGLVIALSFVLLAAVFRSIAIPIKAAAMNLLSIGAAYGVIVAVFQWGWGLSLFGSFGTGPIDPWIPLMMFVITFGLSMDYEMFLLSQMQEDWIRTHDSRGAVASGLASTAKVITAAAAIMICVFGSFVINDPLRILDIFGLGLAVAILIDATLIRMVLVPAVMELLGDRAWWMPGWLERRLPRLTIETEHARA